MPADSKTQTNYADAGAAARALEPDAPLFLFSARALQERAARFLTHFPGLVSYAVKCNPAAPVLQTLRAAGITTFDVASVREIEMVRQAAPSARER